MKKAKKSLSQNFLIDKNICKKIIKQTSLINKIVVEIGPGKGALTDYIINENDTIMVIEDKDKLDKFLAGFSAYFLTPLFNVNVLSLELSVL